MSSKVTNPNEIGDESNKCRELAHDLRTPTGHFVGFIDILHESVYAKLSEEEQKWFDIIKQSAHSLEDKINILLPREEPIKYPVLSDVISDSFKLFALFAATKNIKLESDLAKSIYVDARYDIVRTIIDNLIDNAIKFSKRNSTIQVKASAVFNKVIVTVSNYGEVIRTVDKSKIFINGYSTKDSNGKVSTGIGLYKISNLLKKNGGFIRFDSDVDGKTIFEFYLKPMN